MKISRRGVGLMLVNAVLVAFACFVVVRQSEVVKSVICDNG